MPQGAGRRFVAKLVSCWVSCFNRKEAGQAFHLIGRYERLALCRVPLTFGLGIVTVCVVGPGRLCWARPGCPRCYRRRRTLCRGTGDQLVTDPFMPSRLRARHLIPLHRTTLLIRPSPRGCLHFGRLAGLSEVHGVVEERFDAGPLARPMQFNLSCLYFQSCCSSAVAATSAGFHGSVSRFAVVAYCAGLPRVRGLRESLW